jgi:hypothetical protein
LPIENDPSFANVVSCYANRTAATAFFGVPFMG